MGGKQELAVELRQRGHLAGKLDAVIGEVVFADDLVAFRVPQGQLEAKRQYSGPGGLGPIGKVVDPTRDRTFRDETQGIHKRTRRLAIDA